MLQYSFTWKQLSAVAGISFWNIYFKLVQGAVRAPEVVAFKALRRHLGDRKLLIVWDRLQAHRSRLVREYVESQEGAWPGASFVTDVEQQHQVIRIGRIAIDPIG